MPRKFRTITEAIRSQPKEIAKYLDSIATKHGEGCWFVKHPESNSRVCLVAHIDTIFVSPSNLEISNHILKSAKNEGLGADDRAGVWALLKLYNTMSKADRPMLLFTDGEERGGIGAYEACTVLKEELKNVIFFVELDRQDQKDAVFYCNEPVNFRRYIETFGYKESHGSFSDISILGKFFEVCAVNLSVGYQHQHSKEETLNLKWLAESMRKIRLLLEANSSSTTVWENKKKVYSTDNIHEWGMKDLSPKKKVKTRHDILDYVFSEQIEQKELTPFFGKCQICGDYKELLYNTCKECAEAF